MKATDIRAALRKHYAAPEYAIFFEVADATGARHSRFADAIAMALWPSRGLTVHGFEIKVYRGDWLNEKKNPAKADKIARYCDTWTLVTPAESNVAKLEEIPETWGWATVSASGTMKWPKQAQRMEAQPLDRTFVASMLRSSGKVDEADIQAKVKAAVDVQVKLALDERERMTVRSRDRFTTLSEMLEADPDLRWVDSTELAEAVRAVLKSGVNRSYGGLLYLEKQLRETADQIGKAMGLMSLPKKRGRA